MFHKYTTKVIALLAILTLLCTCGFTGRPCYVPASLSAAVKKTPRFIVLTRYHKELNIGDECSVIAVCSDGSIPTWKSSNSKVATVSSFGKITAKKAGTANITAIVSGASASCKVVVKKTTISLSKTSVVLEKGATHQLSARVSTSAELTWHSKKSSIATINSKGLLCGEKPGTTYVYAVADGTKVSCKVKVKKPDIVLNHTSVTLRTGTQCRLRAKTSSGQEVSWKSSKSSIADIDSDGVVYAAKKGTTRICAFLDGTRKYCTIRVTEK